MVTTLHQLVQGVGHIVAQVVEAELVVRAVGDVRVVGLPAFLRGHAGENDINFQAQETVNTAHPLRVTFSQIVIHRHDVRAFALQGIEVCGKHTGQGLTFTGFHLGDGTEV